MDSVDVLPYREKSREVLAVPGDERASAPTTVCVSVWLVRLSLCFSYPWARCPLLIVPVRPRLQPTNNILQRAS